jgi:N-acetylmuramoyl-L-alanine amidase
MNVKFTLDPGHYTDYNTGIVKGYFEGNEMFKLAGYLKNALEQYNGFTVALTKATLDSDPSLEVRGRYAINNNSTVFLSLHSNAASKESAAGVVLIRSLKRPDSEGLGEQLGEVVAKTMGTYFRGVSTRIYPNTTSIDYYGVLRASVRDKEKVPYSFILEHGFHTNQKECTWLDNDQHLIELAECEAAVFAKYFNATKKNSYVKCDTTLPFFLKHEKTYQFKLTADSKPTFTAGTPGLFTIEFAGQLGRDYLYKITAVGPSKKSSGFYINNGKVPVTVVTIL